MSTFHRILKVLIQFQSQDLTLEAQKSLKLFKVMSRLQQLVLILIFLEKIKYYQSKELQEEYFKLTQ